MPPAPITPPAVVPGPSGAPSAPVPVRDGEHAAIVAHDIKGRLTAVSLGLEESADELGEGRVASAFAASYRAELAEERLRDVLDGYRAPSGLTDLVLGIATPGEPDATTPFASALVTALTSPFATLHGWVSDAESALAADDALEGRYAIGAAQRAVRDMVAIIDATRDAAPADDAVGRAGSGETVHPVRASYGILR